MSVCLAAVPLGPIVYLLGVVFVSPVSPVSPAAKGTCLAVVFCLCGVFVCGFWLLLFGFLCVCCFPLLLACLSSFTDWCIVHRQQSREQKSDYMNFLECVVSEKIYSPITSLNCVAQLSTKSHSSRKCDHT